MGSEGHLVAVGASAGGIEAISALLGGLNKAFPAPVVIAQHLDPTRTSHLGPVLERRSALPIVVVEGRVALENGKVYVVPANRHVVVEDGHVALEGDHADRPRPSVDLLLTTAARAYGDRLIAVILTGSGSDGAAGAVEVKKAGGVVVIQNPATAAYPAMPLALPPTAVDHVAELEGIAPLLLDLLAGAHIPDAMTVDGVLQDILSLVGEKAPVDFGPYKAGTLVRRIGRRMAVTHSRTMADYLALLRRQPQELDELTRSFLIKVTEFFRDAEAFQYLRDDVLPELVERGRQKGKILRVWSAGCATGEEAYSLALLVAEALGPELADWSVKVFATDVDEPAIHFARRGFYPLNVLRNLPEAYAERYFERSDQGYRVSKLLRQMIIFGRQDITRGVPFPRMDLVVCRNLLIYFQTQLQEEMLDVFAYSLHQSRGYLMLGKAETARPSRAVFELVSKKWKLYRCVQAPAAVPLRVGAPAVVPPPERPPLRRAAEADADRLEDELGQLRRFNDLLLRSVPAGIAVIDDRYRIVSINAAARRLLSIREPAINQDFLHAVRGLRYEDVRSAIDQSFRDRTPVTLQEVPLTAGAGEARHVSLQVAPLPPEGLALDCVLVTILDSTEQVRATARAEVLQVEQKQLADELGTANRRLAETNAELHNTNEELQSANEELMLAQEELQATNEEFEATNEELQATNEELETNNEELQATNEELETTNEELQARTAELQELNRVLMSERLRLTEMVELAPLFIIVLRGPALVVEALNPPSARLFPGRMQVVGQPFSDLCEATPLEPLLTGTREVYQRDRRWISGRLVTPMELRNGDVVPRDLVYTVVPSHDALGKVEGVVVYGEDVTEKQAKEDQERAELLRLMIEHAHPVGLGLYEIASGRLLQASPAYTRILQRLGGDGADVTAARFRDLTLMPSASEADDLLATVRRTGQPVRLPELRCRLAADGRDTVWDFMAIPIAFGEREPAQAVRDVVICVFEVTEQVQLREELLKVDRVKDEFLSMASHELRTPLVPLTTYADLLEQLLHDTRSHGRKDWIAEAEMLVGRFRRQIAYLSRLTDDLLDVGRLQTGSFSLQSREVDVRAVVDEVREQAARLPDALPIEVHGPPPGVLHVNGDEGRLVQAVYNLVANAFRHAQTGGRVDIRLEDGPAGIVVDVQDYGPGIPADERAALFTRFHRGNGQRPARGGLGLGLFICRNIVERHGGTVSLVDGAAGTGAVFRIVLPKAEGAERPVRPGPPINLGGRGRARSAVGPGRRPKPRA